MVGFCWIAEADASAPRLCVHAPIVLLAATSFSDPPMIVQLSGASIYMFLSHEADVIRQLSAFAATLRR